MKATPGDVLQHHRAHQWVGNHRSSAIAQTGKDAFRIVTGIRRLCYFTQLRISPNAQQKHQTLGNQNVFSTQRIGEACQRVAQNLKTKLTQTRLHHRALHIFSSYMIKQAIPRWGQER